MGFKYIKKSSIAAGYAGNREDMGYWLCCSIYQKQRPEHTVSSVTPALCGSLHTAKSVGRCELASLVRQILSKRRYVPLLCSVSKATHKSLLNIWRWCITCFTRFFFGQEKWKKFFCLRSRASSVGLPRGF